MSDTAFESINRSNADNRTAREIPVDIVKEIIQDADKASAVMQLGRVTTLPAYQQRHRVFRSYPEAYWLDGATLPERDVALKSTTSMLWDYVVLEPQEIAVMAVVPDTWEQDSDIAWAEIQAKLSGAIAKRLDDTVLFGNSEPTGYTGPSGGVVAAAVAAGNTVTLGDTVGTDLGGGGDGTYNDIGLDIARCAQILADGGYNPTGCAAREGFEWRLVGVRDTTGQPVYQPAAQRGGNPGMYNMNYVPVGNGSWDNTSALMVVGDFSQLIIGVRQDVTFSISDSAPIVDSSNNVVFNTFQQDAKVMRATFRVGVVVPDPTKILGGDFPFAVLRPVGAS